MYPSEFIFDKRPDNSKWLLNNPVENFSVFLKVLKLPTLELNDANVSSWAASVKMFKVAPKAADPFVEVPTPLWSWMLSA